MVTAADIEIVQRTEVHDAVVITGRRRDPNAIRQFRTFVVLPTSKYATNLFDSVSVGAALHRHRQLAHWLEEKQGGETS